MTLPRRAFTKWTRTPTDGTLSSIEPKKPTKQTIPWATEASRFPAIDNVASLTSWMTAFMIRPIHR